MPYPAFILPTYADKGKRRRTRKSRKIVVLSAYRVRLRPLTSAYLQQISSERSPIGCILYVASLAFLLTYFDAGHLREIYATIRIRQFYGDHSRNSIINIVLRTRDTRLNLALRMRTS